MDAITLLKKDHRAVEALFKRFEKAGEKAATAKKEIVAEISRELSIHAAIEEALFYPAARKTLSDDDLVLEALEEHHVVKVLLAEIASLRPTNERYDAKVTVLKEVVQHHVEEEEEDGGIFTRMQKKLSAQDLAMLGDALAMAKKAAPTRPHPSAPDTPPANLFAGLPTALLDRVRDLAFATGKTAATKAKRQARTTFTSPAASPRVARAVKAVKKTVAKKPARRKTAAKKPTKR